MAYLGASVFENCHSVGGSFLTGHCLGKAGSDLGEGVGKGFHARAALWPAAGLL
jgi:hypothetical protein